MVFILLILGYGLFLCGAGLLITGLKEQLAFSLENVIYAIMSLLGLGILFIFRLYG